MCDRLAKALWFIGSNAQPLSVRQGEVDPLSWLLRKSRERASRHTHAPPLPALLPGLAALLRPDASYPNRVVATAVAAVYQDGMAMRRVPERLARDFWVRPSEASIRQWCRVYRTRFDFATDYQPCVVQAFSGVLCVDEVYQGQLAFLFAVDPAAPDSDRLVGYQLGTRKELIIPTWKLERCR